MMEPMKRTRKRKASTKMNCQDRTKKIHINHLYTIDLNVDFDIFVCGMSKTKAKTVVMKMICKRERLILQHVG